MKTRLYLILLFIVVNTVSLWSYSISSVTDFFYYKNKPYYLNTRNNKLFIKTKDVLTESTYRQLTGQFFQVSQQTKFDKGIKEQFIDLVSNYDNANLNAIISSLKNNRQIELASVVYSPPDNDKVLQGLEDQCIAQFKPYVTSSQINDYLNAHGLSIVKQLEISGGTTYILHVSSNVTCIDAANTIFESGLVNFCDPDFYYSGLLAFIPNDTFFPMQWALRNLGNNIPGGVTGTAGCDMHVDSAWNTTTGNTHCIVGMVDTGIDTTHPDIIGNMTHGANWDFINGNPGCYDDHNHGTCTAGLVAATGNNNLGISGVCPLAKLIGVKIFNSAGSTTTTALTQGLTWSWTQGEWISSNSWGGGSPVAAADQTIVDGTNLGRSGKGTVFCVASGNGNGPVQWPATNPNVVCVGGNSPCNERKSTTSCDLENFWGASFGTGLSVVAPCVKVYSTDRQGANGYDPTDYFATFNGTSSATPNCAGVIALGLSRDSTVRWDTVRSRICWTADKVGAYAYTSAGPYGILGATWNNEMGYGKVNAYRFVLSFGTQTLLAHNIAVGPFLSLPQGNLLINTNYNIKTKVQNIGSSNETGIPVKFFVNNTLISTANINLNVNQDDSVNNVWTTPTAGTYNLMYVSGLATDLDRTNDTVRTIVNVLTVLPALCEDFTNPAFPPTGWTENFTGTNYWSRSTVSRVGVGSLYYDMWNAPNGTVQSMITPTFPATVAGTSLVFVFAYQPFNTAPDSLVIYASTNAGTTWTEVPGGRYGNTSMGTTTGQPTPFVPSAPGQWTTKQTGLLPPGTNKIQLYGRSGFGDNMYVDSVCLVTPVGISHNENVIPKVYSLSQNYPNPFNPTTTISYGLPKAGLVKLVIYDLLGREVTTLVNGHKEAGTYDISFDASGISSGVYFYKVESGDFSSIKKMVLIK